MKPLKFLIPTYYLAATLAAITGLITFTTDIFSSILNDSPLTSTAQPTPSAPNPPTSIVPADKTKGIIHHVSPSPTPSNTTRDVEPESQKKESLQIHELPSVAAVDVSHRCVAISAKLRSRPDEFASCVTIVDQGDIVLVSDQPSKDDWFLVTHEKSGQKGYLRKGIDFGRL